MVFWKEDKKLLNTSNSLNCGRSFGCPCRGATDSSRSSRTRWNGGRTRPGLRVLGGPSRPECSWLCIVPHLPGRCGCGSGYEPVIGVSLWLPLWSGRVDGILPASSCTSGGPHSGMFRLTRQRWRGRLSVAIIISSSPREMLAASTGSISRGDVMKSTGRWGSSVPCLRLVQVFAYAVERR